MKAVFVTTHYWDSRRKAGMHWLADTLRSRGWDILFFTVGMSWPLWIRRKDWRLTYPVRKEANRLVQKAPGVSSFVWITPWHPTRLPHPLLDRLAAPLYRRYPRFPLGPAENAIRGADLLVFESSVALLLVQRLKALAPGARTVYRISDDMRLLDYHPVVEQAEAVAIDECNVLSIPSRSVYAQHARRRHARFHPQGLRTDLFDAPGPDPYPEVPARTRAVFVGNSHLDRDSLRIAADLRPEWEFHIIGPLLKLPDRANIFGYGELPFEQTIPYLAHADVGLNIRSVEPGSACLAESLKVIQYTYCRLPILAPLALRTVGEHFAYYEPGDPASIEAALSVVSGMDASDVDRSWVRTWDEIVDDLLGDVGLEKA